MVQAILVPVLALVGGIVGALVQYSVTRRQRRTSEFDQYKQGLRALYRKFLNHAESGGVDALREDYNEVYMAASDEVVSAMSTYWPDEKREEGERPHDAEAKRKLREAMRRHVKQEL